MHLLNIRNLETIKSVKRGDIFGAKTGKSTIIGPEVTPSFCINCFKLRILSSSFFDFKKYKELSENELLNYANILRTKNKMIEIFVDGKIREHNILSVPGCNHEK